MVDPTQNRGNWDSWHQKFCTAFSFRGSFGNLLSGVPASLTDPNHNFFLSTALLVFLICNSCGSLPYILLCCGLLGY